MLLRAVTQHVLAQFAQDDIPAQRMRLEQWNEMPAEMAKPADADEEPFHVPPKRLSTGGTDSCLYVPSVLSPRRMLIRPRRAKTSATAAATTSAAGSGTKFEFSAPGVP